VMSSGSVARRGAGADRSQRCAVVGGLDWDALAMRLERLPLCRPTGRITRVVGLTIESWGPPARIGDVCDIEIQGGRQCTVAEIVGFRDRHVLLMPLGDMQGVGPGCRVLARGRSLQVPVGPELLGRVVDGLGRPIDGRGDIPARLSYPLDSRPPAPLARRRITRPLAVGVRAIDGLLTCGRGQRLGIFSGSGVGKSTLLGMIARNTEADVNVIALIGERGREVRDFIEKDLQHGGLDRSVVVVATSDQPALLRLRAAFCATAIAECFRDQGADVLFMMDSVTRFAMAQREIGLAVGEPPTTRGYTPSVFALLPRLLERAGTSDKGSVTAFYTVLVDGDDMNEPVADAMRGILDGHIVLSRDLAADNHYPAIDVLPSVSRLMADVASPEHQEAAAVVRSMMAAYRRAEDLVNIGAYAAGSNPRIDQALRLIEPIRGFLRQAVRESASMDAAVARLREIAAEAEAAGQEAAAAH